MRWPLPLLLLALSGCPADPPSFPLDICETYNDPCTAGFECIGYHCVAECDFEGDCDLGFRCVEGQCLQGCEAEPDCTIGKCLPLGDERPGSACALINLPACALDDHCGWGVCEDGKCLRRCDFPDACGFGESCDFRRGDYGACVSSE